MYEEHFQEEGLKEFEIDGAKFSYKPTTTEEETDWIKEYMILDESGKYVQDIAKLNKCRIRNLKKVPYSKDTIKKLIGIDKEYDSLSFDEKWMLLGKLKPSIFSKIIKQIDKIEYGDKEEINQKKT